MFGSRVQDRLFGGVDSGAQVCDFAGWTHLDEDEGHPMLAPVRWCLSPHCDKLGHVSMSTLLRLVALSGLFALLAIPVWSADDVDDDDDKTGSGVINYGPPPPVAPAVVSRDAAGRVTVRATRISEPIVVDGKLDDEVYARVVAMSGFIQQEPDEGALATEKTEVWVFFDDDNIYISARCWDSHPERMVVNEMRRDNGNIFQNENLVVVLDTFYDRRNGFFFQTNPLGALRDQAFGDEGQSRNVDWNTVWDVGASVFDQGWIAEIVIPFKSLRYKKGRDQIWSFNVLRVVRWKNEQSFLSPVAASHRVRGIYRVSEAATLVGIQAPLSSRNLELKPYGISTVVTNNDAEPVVSNDVNADVGFDLKYGLTKSLIADFTFNTDFAQVEEDQQRVNLTRFSLFFPEKRDFFLEGQSIFAFAGVQLRRGGFNRPGGAGGNLTPIMFFSRRIGITEDGIDPITVGGRLTGRAGAYRIGVLNIQTEGIDDVVDATNFSVVRVRRDVLGRSDIGAIATYRRTSVTDAGVSNGLLGLDGNFAFFTNLRMNAYYAVTQTKLEEGTPGGDESSYMGRLDYGGDRYGLQLEHLKVGESFKPELGFMRREAFKRSFGQARFSPRATSIDSIRRFIFQGELDYITGEPAGIVETRRLQGQAGIEFAAGDRTTVEYTKQYEFLPEDFEISDGIILPAGSSYNFQEVRFIYRFGAQRVLPGSVTYRRGSFFSGDRNEFTFSGRIEVTPQFSIEPRLAFNFVDLPEGDFKSNLLSARVSYSMSPRMFVSGLFQFASSSNSLSSNVRFRWEYEPGSDLFIVYSDGRETGLEGFPLLLNRTFAVKMTKLFRF